MESVSFDRLTADVQTAATGSDPLDLVDAAIMVAAGLTDHADALVDHFVAAARTAGRTWTEIGARLGVSKQAARKRFADPSPTVVLPAEVTLRPRLQTCLTQAGVYAQAAGATEIGEEHLLAGLLADGVAATILDKLGVTADAITTSTARLFGPPGPPPDTVPPLSAAAVCAIEGAAHHAQGRAEDPHAVTVGTEHLLVVLAFDHGSRARRILADMDVDIASVKKELACYVTANRPQPRRRFGRQPRAATATCSFCGTAESATRPLAHGPGVLICAACAQRAMQNLTARSTN
jgi:ATP-dependent Clp protease ATP-binding subunit ClpA